MLAIIGGSGLTQLSNMEIERREVVRTPYGEPSGALALGGVCDEPVVFLARHGYGHTIRRTWSITAPTSGRSRRPRSPASSRSPRWAASAPTSRPAR